MLGIFGKFGIADCITFLGILLTLIGGILSTYQKNQYENKLLAKTTNTENFTKKSYDLNTSAGSFCYLAQIDDKVSSLVFALVHQGANPLYDVKIRIVDLAKHKKIQSAKGHITLQDAMSIDTQLLIGNLGVGKVVILDHWKISKTDQLTFDVYFEALHGAFVQRIRLHRLQNRYALATVLTQLGDSENPVLFTSIDPDYPRDEKGQISWK